MAFRVGVDGQVALVEVSHDRVGQQRMLQWHCDGPLGHQQRHARTLRLIVLAGDIQYIGADHVCNPGQDAGQTIGVVLLIDILDVLETVRGRARIANIVDVEAQGLGQIVKAMQGQLAVAGGRVRGHVIAIRFVYRQRQIGKRTAFYPQAAGLATFFACGPSKRMVSTCPWALH